MGTAAKLHVLRFLEGVAQQFPASWADEGVMGVRVQHEDEVGKVVDQAAREFLLLMEPMLHLAPFGDIHDRALVPDDLSASVAHGGGAVHAHDRASIFAEKRDFAALDHRLRLHLLLQDLAFGDRKSTRLNSSHGYISYAVFCLKKKKYTSNSIMCLYNT